MPMINFIKMNIKNHMAHVTALLAFSAAFLIGPVAQSNYLTMMPGDIGDARLNNYFLENIYQFFAGRSDSLWHLGFFSEFPYVLGFSDNLFGSSPVYLAARFLTDQSDTAFQIWYLFGFFINFIAAYYAINKLGASKIAAAVGALTFAFALPVTAHSGHAQLHYRFGAPLSIAMFILFLDKKDWRYFVISGAWMVWQFYCTIYIGFFTLLMLSAILIAYLADGLRSSAVKNRHTIIELVRAWSAQPVARKAIYLIALFLLLLLLILLFYPYWRVTQLYNASRSATEIATMLPRPQSYFLSDLSRLWSSQANIFADIPMRHEHQMFIGVMPMLLAMLGFLFGSKKEDGLAFTLLSASLLSLILITLYVGGYSFWFIFSKLPLASAIRAMTRIDLVLLFPAAYLAAIAVDQLRSRTARVCKMVPAVVMLAMIFEFSAVSAPLSTKSEWRARLVENEAQFPELLPPEPILFFAQSKGPFYASELDAMWVAINHSVKTLNGYSGIFPPGFSPKYNDDCAEMPRRVMSLLAFNRQADDKDAYLNLMERVVPVGFRGCNPRWMSTPSITASNREYTDEVMRKLSYEYTGKHQINGQWVVHFKINNPADHPISARSLTGKPVRFSWRFTDSTGKPMSGWILRKNLPIDIPANNHLELQLPIDPGIEIKGGSLQISIVQEAVFWAHDVGLPPLTIPWD